MIPIIIIEEEIEELEKIKKDIDEKIKLKNEEIELCKMEENLNLGAKVLELEAKYGELRLSDTIGKYALYEFDNTNHYVFIKEGNKIKAIIEPTSAINIAYISASYYDLKDKISKNK